MPGIGIIFGEQTWMQRKMVPSVRTSFIVLRKWILRRQQSVRPLVLLHRDRYNELKEKAWYALIKAFYIVFVI